MPRKENKVDATYERQRALGEEVMSVQRFAFHASTNRDRYPRTSSGIKKAVRDMTDAEFGALQHFLMDGFLALDDADLLYYFFARLEGRDVF